MPKPQKHKKSACRDCKFHKAVNDAGRKIVIIFNDIAREIGPDHANTCMVAFCASIMNSFPDDVRPILPVMLDKAIRGMNTTVKDEVENQRYIG